MNVHRAKPALNVPPICRILDPIGPAFVLSPTLRAHSFLRPLHDSLALPNSANSRPDWRPSEISELSRAASAPAAASGAPDAQVVTERVAFSRVRTCVEGLVWAAPGSGIRLWTRSVPPPWVQVFGNG